MAELSEHARANRDFWERESDAYQERHARHLARGAAWGVWQIPESEVRALGDVAGQDVLELGCGAARWSIALAEAGARPVGVDISARQLEHARAVQLDAGVDFPVLEASAESVPLEDASFDVVFCDHGAFSFADPARVVPEAARLLRPGGLLAFSTMSPMLDVCWDQEADRVGDRLRNDYFQLRRFDWDDGSVNFQLPYGEWIRLLRASGLVVEDLIELRPPPDGSTTYDSVELDWARRWPAENIWKARRSGPAAQPVSGRGS